MENPDTQAGIWPRIPCLPTVVSLQVTGLTPTALGDLSSHVEPSLRLIDLVLGTGRGFNEILADRHYSYKKSHRWAKKLITRGIDQVVDLHMNDQGFRDYHGAKLGAGCLHCPGTPDDLGTILPPPPGSSKEVIQAAEAEIDKRWPYAFRRTRRWPTPRFECPALAGKVGCPLRKG